MAARRRCNEVDRKICFYRIDAGLDEAGRPVRFDPEPFLAQIEALPFNGMRSRYSDEEGGALCCWIDRCTRPYRLYFGKARWEDQPLKEHNGARSPLELGENESLLEGVHAVVFYAGPYWFIGCEYNFYGPRITRLAKYLAEKSGCPGLTIMPLIRHDAEEKLSALQDVRLFWFRIHPSYVATLAKTPRNDDIEGFLDSAQRLGRVHSVDVILRSEFRSKSKLPLSLANYLLQLVKSPEASTGIVEAKIRGLDSESGHVELIDMLNAQITAKVRVARAGPRTSAPNSEALYAAIEAAYDRNKPKLLLAAGLTFGSGGSHEPGDSVA